jgi:hypothetical protein
MGVESGASAGSVLQLCGLESVEVQQLEQREGGQGVTLTNSSSAIEKYLRHSIQKYCRGARKKEASDPLNPFAKKTEFLHDQDDCFMFNCVKSFLKI